jgi:hypothetical protein
MKTLGRQTVADLGAAGFSESRMEFRRLGRLHGYCAVARAVGSAGGSGTGMGESPWRQVSGSTS